MMGELLLRADAGPSLGVGHVMRSIALGEAWRRAGGSATLLTRCGVRSLLDRASASGLNVETMDDSQSEEACVISRCKGVEAVALDGYHFEPALQATCKRIARTLVIDDYAHHSRYHTHLLLNQNLGAESFAYIADPETRFLLGPRYALLRREFTSEPRPEFLYRAPREILVTLGGAAPAAVTELVLQGLALVDIQAAIKVVLGPASLASHQVVDAARRVRAQIIPAAENMRTCIESADLVIGAAGSTCWELCYCRRPSILIVLADNQRAVAAMLHEAGAALNLGDAGRIVPQTVAGAVASLWHDVAKRKAMAIAAGTVADGLGGERVVAALRAVE